MHRKFFVQNFDVPLCTNSGLREGFRRVFLLLFFGAEALTASAGFMAPNGLCHPAILRVRRILWTTLIVSEADWLLRLH